MSAPITLIEEQSSLLEALSHILHSRGKEVEALAEMPDSAWQPTAGSTVVVDWGMTDVETIRQWVQRDGARVMVTALLIEKAEALQLLRSGVWSIHRKPLNVRDFLEDLGEAEDAAHGAVSVGSGAVDDNLENEDGDKRPALHLLGPSDAAAELRSSLETETVKSAPPWIAVHGPAGTRKDTLARLWHTARFGGEGEFVARACRDLDTESWDEEIVTAAGEPGSLLKPAAGPRTVYLESVETLGEERQQRLSRVLTRDETGVCVVLGLDGDLESLFDAGHLSSGLYSRLSLSTLETSPLVERREDVVEMAQLIARSPRPGFPPAKGIRESAAVRLQTYKWPGNLRELEHVVLYARRVAAGEWIEAAHLETLLG